MPDITDAMLVKIAALTVLVQSLYTHELARSGDPVATGEAIIKGVFDTEAQVRALGGDDAASIRITEEITSIIDGAVMKALTAPGVKRST